MLLADDHRLFIEGLSRLLVLTCEVKWMVNNGRELVSTAAQLVADVVVSHPSMTVLNGMAVRMLPRADIRGKFVVVTVHSDLRVAAKGFRSVASAYALKQASAEEIYAAITTALCEGKYFSASFPVGLVMDDQAVRRPYKEEAELTCRPREVLQLVAEGKTMKKAPSLLNLSTLMVESYQYEIMNALAVHSHAELCPICNARGGDYRRTNAFCAA